MTKKTYEYGVNSELKAIEMLRKKKYKIIKQRYKTKFGEIDIIAEISQTLIFIEVKARKNTELIEVILRKNQIERIKNAAQIFVAENEQYHNFDIRFDFIIFEGDSNYQHLEAFFE